MTDTIIIGAGLAGLTAANYLHRAGHSFVILEGADRVGGRVKTTEKDGFLLDHGFQVFAMAYPEAKALLDYNALDLRRFAPGALLLQPDGQKDQIGDPLRNWSSLLPTIRAKAGGLGSKINILRLKQRLGRQSVKEIFQSSERPTAEVLRRTYGFDEEMVQRFFQPFYSGIFLEKDLTTSRRMFDFVFKMFAEGEVAVPNSGMQAIPQQLADNLPSESIQLNSQVTDIEGGKVTLQDGRTLEGRRVLLATKATGLTAKYMPEIKREHVGTTHVHFSTAILPIRPKLIALNTRPEDVTNSVTVMNQIAPGYAPPKHHLISVSIVGQSSLSTDELAQKIKLELAPWFGPPTASWFLVDRRDVPYALPAQQRVRHDLPHEAFQLSEQLFVCGDHLLNGSINAAMRSGRLAAEAILDR